MIWKQASFILFFIALLCSFIVKGVFFSVIMPLFQNPDEQIHYSTIQEQFERIFSDETSKKYLIANDGSTFNFSEEIIRSAEITQFYTVKSQDDNTSAYTLGSSGTNETEILRNQWDRYPNPNYKTRPEKSTPLYYTLGAIIDCVFGKYSIFIRVFFLRLLSLCFGVGVVLLAFAIARKLNFSSLTATLIATLVAFQPMFSASAAQINIDIALIFSYSLFIYFGITLLKEGWRWQRALLLLLSVIIAILSKGPGIVLAVVACPLLFFSLHECYGKHQHFWKYALLSSLGVLVFLAFLIPHSYFVSITNVHAKSYFSSPSLSLSNYFNKTFRISEFKETRASYWGNFGWLDTKIANSVLNLITLIELVATIGLIVLFTTKHLKSYLPQKRFLVFFLGITIALQLAIRFYDWRVFDQTSRIIIGTPGRYFLPTIIPHMILVISGLGAFTKNKEQFQILLKALALGMILLSLYALLDVIVPRYYL